MKRTIIALLTASALVAAAAPALAQYGPPPGGGPAVSGWDLNRKVQWTQTRIQSGRADGSLSPGEFNRALAGLNRIRNEYRMVRNRNYGRLPAGDAARLDAEVNNLLNQIHWMRANDVRRPW